ncbi:MAG: sigma-70 family RNA polymerase sigma factor [Acidobacteria bacterium]|nr:sigma-70 family RNA polymerase sigma factor [Acidobacteriota bacterium]
MNPQVTQLLNQWKEGDESALQQITGLLYPELKRIASSYLSRERTGHILQTTALVNEAYIQFGGLDTVSFQDRTHFLALAARIMRQILVQHARASNAAKRGGEWKRIELEPGVEGLPDSDSAILDIDEALSEFARVDPDRARVVELRYFGGLTVDEIAAALGSSASTVTRQLRVAHAWLHRYLSK